MEVPTGQQVRTSHAEFWKQNPGPETEHKGYFLEDGRMEGTAAGGKQGGGRTVRWKRQVRPGPSGLGRPC